MRRFFGVSQLPLQICRPVAVRIGLLQSKPRPYSCSEKGTDAEPMPSLLNNKVALANLRRISTNPVEMQRRLTGIAGLL